MKKRFYKNAIKDGGHRIFFLHKMDGRFSNYSIREVFLRNSNNMKRGTIISEKVISYLYVKILELFNKIVLVLHYKVFWLKKKEDYETN